MHRFQKLILLTAGITSCSGGLFGGKSDSIAVAEEMEKGRKFHERWTLYRDTQAMVKARDHYHRALEIDDTHWHAWNNVGTTYADLGSYRDALPYFRGALRIRPNYREGWFNVGLMHYNLAEKDSAIYYIGRCLETDSAYIEAYKFLDIIYRDQQDTMALISTWKMATTNAPDSYHAWDMLAGLYFQQGDTVASVAAGEKAIAIDASNRDRVFNLYSYFILNGDSAKAKYYYDMLHPNGSY